MNDVMILRRGGGVKLFAAIGVTYPAGSTCTCTGKNTGKVLTAKDTSGQWIFAVPEADEWTVAISAEGKSREKTVSITGKNQFEKIVMTYSLEILTRENGLAEGYALDETSITPAIDVTDYTKLRITGKRSWASAVAMSCTVGLSDTVNGETAENFFCTFDSDAETTHEIDISDISGEWYFAVDGNVFEMDGNALHAGTVSETNGQGATGEVYEIVFHG